MRIFQPLLLFLIAALLTAGAAGKTSESADEWARAAGHQTGADALLLVDGRRVQPQGIEIPEPAGRAMLHELTAGKNLRLAVDPAMRADRYGRIPAHIFTAGNPGSEIPGGEIWVQEQLLAAGLAYACPFAGRDPLMPRLLHIERDARAAKRGIWQSPLMQPLAAGQAAAAIGRYAFIRGKVTQAAKTRDKIYLNFGADWRRDFTVMIEKPDWKNFKDMDLLGLQGRTIIARGFLHQDNGPMLRAGDPGQIEVAGGGE